MIILRGPLGERERVAWFSGTYLLGDVDVGTFLLGVLLEMGFRWAVRRGWREKMHKFNVPETGSMLAM